MQVINIHSHTETSFVPFAAAKPSKASAIAGERLAQKKTQLPGFGAFLKSLLIAGPSYLAVLSIRVTACFFSIFGTWGKGVAEKLRCKAAKFHAIYVVHNLITLSAVVSPPLPLLAQAKNIARCDVIRKEEDVKAANVMRERFLSPSFRKEHQLPEFEMPMIKRLQQAKFEGAKADGICYGASLVFLKAVLSANCVSEAQLQALAKPFAKGFSGEGAGLQMFYEKVLSSPREKEEWKELLKRERQRLDQYFEAKQKQIDDEVSPERLKQLNREIEIRGKELLENFDKLIPLLQTAAKLKLVDGLFGLKQHKQNEDMLNFWKFEHDEATRKRFDELPIGAYQLSLKIEHAGHAVVYLKFDFGSYLFDPNHGLMKCKSSSDLQKLLKSYPVKKEGSHHLGVIRYELK